MLSTMFDIHVPAVTVRDDLGASTAFVVGGLLLQPSVTSQGIFAIAAITRSRTLMVSARNAIVMPSEQP
ncbi:hypothetical protein SAMN04489716_1139 [Actinoplanes derwentensis]|uniref:Uncharacterized protein n=1 Tax=Actinoplanes derwentensis TaxID=113562 RepID=A0A1H1TH78_9ACTN|nr:hypothetical protein Ade03nite_39530 [Actinoplanes derwentensis]SDS59558.1 hypothetical protein SAMN04489716_1139 [Actinoplanes derwentensis]